MAHLNNTALRLLTDDEELQIAIGKLFTPARKVRTVKRWINDNDKRLTTLDVLNLIKGKYGVSDFEILSDLMEEKGLTTAI